MRSDDADAYYRYRDPLERELDVIYKPEESDEARLGGSASALDVATADEVDRSVRDFHHNYR